ncbi:PIN domain-containing protein [Streptomyces sp. NPDC006386]|uniref:PIN domain-containing protein n=1 Tax=Streptomyces sp. NPDC006386 TaxID=3156762 RepID=UPI0033A6C572
MIILDACTVEGMSLQGSSAELLRALREIGVQRIGIPWPAMQELIAHKTMEYQAAHTSAVSALNQLNRRTPWEESQQLPPLRLEDAREHWLSEFAKLAEVIPVSPEILQESMFREANVLPPCKTVGAKKNKIGGRDAAIWLSAIEFAERNEEETIYFVSGNTNDFTDGSEYPELMAQDLRKVRNRFVHLTALDDVVSRFAQPCEVDATEAEEALLHPEVATAISDALVRTYPRQRSNRVPMSSQFGAMVDPSDPWRVRAAGWWTGYTAQLTAVHKIQGYQIGWHKWCMSTTRWVVVGLAQIPGRPPTLAATIWEVRLLFSLAEREGGTPFTILRSFKPEAPSTDRDANIFGALIASPPTPFDADPFDVAEDGMTHLERDLWSRVKGSEGGWAEPAHDSREW